MVLSIFDVLAVLVVVLWQVETDVQLHAVLNVAKVVLAGWIITELLSASSWIPPALGLA